MTEAIQKQQAGASGLIEKLLPAIKKAVPKHLDPNRLGRVFLTELRNNPKLMRCSSDSLLGAFLLCAQLGLEPGVLGMAYLIPYNNKHTGKLECQFQLGYKGMIQLARNSGLILNVNAEVVYENDEFDHELGLTPKLYHKPAEKNRGKMRCAYAYAQMRDGASHFIVLTREEIEKIRKVSKAKKSGPWFDWESEMWKKTALKRLCKLLPFAIETERSLAQDETTKYIADDILDEPDQTDWGEEDTEELNHKAQEKVKVLKEKALEYASANDIESFVERAHRTFEDVTAYSAWLNDITNGHWDRLPDQVTVSQLKDLNKQLDDHIGRQNGKS